MSFGLLCVLLRIEINMRELDAEKDTDPKELMHSNGVVSDVF